MISPLPKKATSLLNKIKMMMSWYSKTNIMFSKSRYSVPKNYKIILGSNKPFLPASLSHLMFLFSHKPLLITQLKQRQKKRFSWSIVPERRSSNSHRKDIFVYNLVFKQLNFLKTHILHHVSLWWPSKNYNLHKNIHH